MYDTVLPNIFAVILSVGTCFILAYVIEHLINQIRNRSSFQKNGHNLSELSYGHSPDNCKPFPLVPKPRGQLFVGYTGRLRMEEYRIILEEYFRN